MSIIIVFLIIIIYFGKVRNSEKESKKSWHRRDEKVRNSKRGELRIVTNKKNKRNSRI